MALWKSQDRELTTKRIKQTAKNQRLKSWPCRKGLPQVKEDKGVGSVTSKKRTHKNLSKKEKESLLRQLNEVDPLFLLTTNCVSNLTFRRP